MITIKVPKQIQVGGHTYSIALSKDLKDSDSWGAVNNRLQIIVINIERPESQRVEALIHEILHVINNVYHNGNLEEGDVSDVSEGFCQVFSQLGIKLDWSEVPVKEWELP